MSFDRKSGSVLEPVYSLITWLRLLPTTLRRSPEAADLQILLEGTMQAGLVALFELNLSEPSAIMNFRGIGEDVDGKSSI